jgi:hypothetical protein
VVAYISGENNSTGVNAEGCLAYDLFPFAVNGKGRLTHDLFPFEAFAFRLRCLLSV